MTEEADRRVFTRVHFDAEASFTIKEASYSTTIADISLKGALLDCDQAGAIAEGQTGHLNIKLSDALHLKMKFKVAHVHNGLIGALFTNIDLDSMTHLRQILELNMGNTDVLHRELNDLVSHDDTPPLQLH